LHADLGTSVTSKPSPPPAILALPDVVWINPPIQETQQNQALQQTAA
jgi:hypothetical protein